MPVDVSRFVTPENEWNGLHGMADTLRRQDYHDQQVQQQQQAKRAANAKFLADYLDPKQHLTGTVYDPQIARGFNELLTEGASLAQQGADANMLMMALAPKVNRLSEYATKAKLLNQNLDKQLEAMRGMKGYDPAKLREESRKLAFFDENGQIKDIETIDPSADYLTETVKLYPERVTNDSALDDFVKSSPRQSAVEDVTTYGLDGGMSRRKMKMTYPAWMKPDTDERKAVTGFVPDYEVAVDGGQPVMHDFEDGKGGKVTAPVRMVKEDLFTQIMGSNSGIADYVRGQVNAKIKAYKEATGKSIDSSSPQARNLAKGILYDELKRRNPSSMEEVEVNNKPSAPMVRNYFTGNPYAPRSSGSGSGGGLTLNDLFKGIEEAARQMREDYRASNARTNGVDLSSLSTEEQEAVLGKARNLAADNDLTPDELKIIMGDDNRLGVYRKDDGRRIGYLTQTGVNLKAQPSVKEKRAVIEKGNQATTNFIGVPKGGF